MYLRGDTGAFQAIVGASVLIPTCCDHSPLRRYSGQGSRIDTENAAKSGEKLGG